MKFSYLISLLTVFFISIGYAKAVFIYKNMPDFYQADTRFGNLPNGGISYCAPTAISNSLVWLGINGYPKLVDDKKITSQTQYKLIKKISGPEYMNVDPKKGVSFDRIIDGLEKYIRSCGYKSSIKWKGYTYITKYNVGKYPTPNWIANGLLGSSNVAVSLGFYNYNPKTNTYNRIAGHLVSVVGLKHTKLIIHDPSSPGGKKDEVYSFSRIKSGTIIDGKEFKPRPAKDYWELKGINKVKEANTAIIDGALVFKVYK